ncbi:MAG: 16S rRNA (cytosine(1402)-N(4))-methyltransferase RsmH [bacterium]
MYHEPVLLQKVAEFLIHDRNGIYLDGTLGGGGHAESILEHLSLKAQLIGLDLDTEATRFAGDRLLRFGKRVHIENCNFKDFEQVLRQLNISRLDGILLDLGLSSHQIDTADRGFSYSLAGRLDMRMDSSQGLTAEAVVNTYSEGTLASIFRDYGEERRARAIARAIRREREKSRIVTTLQLRQIVSRVLPPQFRVKSLARVFQALRIAVNEELSNLNHFLEKSSTYLKPGGRIVVIAYHSLEDRAVKTFFRQQAAACVCPPELPVCICGQKSRLKILTRRPVRPQEEEINRNPRSRSARLRAAEVIR